MSRFINFYKYQGTGNDFIITSDVKELTTKEIKFLCDRKYGIGADGIILMNQDSSLDFDMMYFNADGSESFCGNGSRCAVMHAHLLKWIKLTCKFNSNDGEHEATIEGNIVKLKMHNVSDVEVRETTFVTNTGSPHYVQFRENLDFDIVSSARDIRYSNEFKEDGINVNYVKSEDDSLQIRTYERGVEDETLSCGTGVTAAVISEYLHLALDKESYQRKVQTQGGDLIVSFSKTKFGFEDVYLHGPAVQVFVGKVFI